MREESRGIELLLSLQNVFGVEEGVLLQFTRALDQLFGRSRVPRDKETANAIAPSLGYLIGQFPASRIGIGIRSGFNANLRKALLVVMSHQPGSRVGGLRGRIEITFLDLENRAQLAFR